MPSASLTPRASDRSPVFPIRAMPWLLGWGWHHSAPYRLCLQPRGVEFIATVKERGSLLPVPPIVFRTATVEDDVQRVIDGEALEQAIIFPEEEIAVKSRTVDFALRIKLAGGFARVNRLRQHASEAIRVAKFPMGFGVVGIGLYWLTE